jgi:hypothetical protein
MNARAALGKETRVVPFSAANIDHTESFDARELEELRRVDPVAVDVVAGTRERCPRIGVPSIDRPHDDPSVRRYSPTAFTRLATGRDRTRETFVEHLHRIPLRFADSLQLDRQRFDSALEASKSFHLAGR